MTLIYDVYSDAAQENLIDGGSGLTVNAQFNGQDVNAEVLDTVPAGQTVGEAEEIPLFFTLIPVLALLSNYDQENCLINIGTERKFGMQIGRASCRERG